MTLQEKTEKVKGLSGRPLQQKPECFISSVTLIAKR
jgi:hypothetical protein